LAEATIQAKRYAQAAFQIAQEQHDIERWIVDLGKIATLAHVQEFMDALNNPAIQDEAKRSLLDSQFKTTNKMALNLVYLLVAKGKFNLIKGINDTFRQLVDELQGIDKAEVTTAVPLDNEEKLRIIQYLGKVRGKKVVITEKVDDRIIGGVIARVGGKIIDGSTATRLSALRNDMAESGR
jgi:F-type H+-transporting ATPase subunit delta